MQDNREYITKMMESQGIKGNPRDYVIISNWRCIQDISGNYELEVYMPDDLVGKHVWILQRDKTDELMPVIVQASLADGMLLVSRSDGACEFTINRNDVHPLAIPPSPKLVHKSVLKQFIGIKTAKKFWNLGRAVALKAPQPKGGWE